MNLNHAQDIAVKAARAGAEVINAKFGQGTQITKKGAIDLVTEADTGAEKAIITTLKAAFPDHGILAEESGVIGQDGPYRWVIDPLDGTTNFAHGLPLFAVSIALVRRGALLVGVVLNPVTGDLFHGVKGGGAWLNETPIRGINHSADG